MTKSLVIERRAKGNRHCSAFSWDSTSEEIRLQLRNGSPRVDVLVRDREIIVSPLTLQPGEEQIVTERLRDLLT